VPITVSQANDARDALAKELYSRIFTWLVAKINASTAAPPNPRAAAPPGTIGLLDIFGFESFQINRFEQLLINYANEGQYGSITPVRVVSMHHSSQRESVCINHDREAGSKFINYRPPRYLRL
jgi:hypothetical protein